MKNIKLYISLLVISIASIAIIIISFDNNASATTLDELDVSYGNVHSIHLIGKKAYTTGRNYYGQLGKSDSSHSEGLLYEVVSQADYTGTDIVKVFAVGNTSYMLDINGDLFAFGDFGRINWIDTMPNTDPIIKDSDGNNSINLVSQNVVDFVADDDVLIIKKTDNLAYSLGTGHYGEAAINHHRDNLVADAYTETQLEDTGGLFSKEIKRMEMVSDGLMVLTTDNKLYAAGNNNTGRFGFDNYENSYVLKEITGTAAFSHSTVDDFSLGTSNAAVIVGGVTYISGRGTALAPVVEPDNDCDWTAQECSTFVAVKDSTDWTNDTSSKVYVTDRNLYILDTDGYLYAAGEDKGMGNGDNTGQSVAVPMLINDNSSFTNGTVSKVITGSVSAAIIDQNNRVMYIGQNQYYISGISTSEDYVLVPEEIDSYDSHKPVFDGATPANGFITNSDVTVDFTAATTINSSNTYYTIDGGAQTPLTAGMVLSGHGKYFVYIEDNNGFSDYSEFTIDKQGPSITDPGAQTVMGGDEATWLPLEPSATDQYSEPLSAYTHTYYDSDCVSQTLVSDLASARSHFLTAGTLCVVSSIDDNLGNSSSISILYTGSDTAAPTIAAPGSTTVNTSGASTFNPPVLAANDSVDGDLTGSVTKTYYLSDNTTSTDLATARTELYAGRSIWVHYYVEDSASNSATREVEFTAIDDTTPSLSGVINGTHNDIDHMTWVPIPGLTSNDNVDGDISGNIDINYYQSDKTTLLGIDDAAGLDAARQYLRTHGNVLEVEYSIQDAAGNTFSVFGSVTSLSADTTAPSFGTTPTDKTVNTSVSQAWTHDLATAADSFDGDVTGSIAVTYLNSSLAPLADIAAARNELETGNNIFVDYVASDAAGNTDSIRITITSNDDVAPVFDSVPTNNTANSSTSSTWIHDTYTATDLVDGDVSGRIVITYYEDDGITLIPDLASARNLINEGKNIEVHYALDDTSGNAASTQVVTITTTDDIIPTLSGVVDTNIDTATSGSWNPSVPTISDNTTDDLSGNLVTTYYLNDDTGASTSDLATARTHLSTNTNYVHVEYVVTDVAGNSSTVLRIKYTGLSGDVTAPNWDTASQTINVNTSDASSWTENSVVATDPEEGVVAHTTEFFEADGTTPLLDQAAARIELAAGRSVVVVYTAADSIPNTSTITITYDAVDNTLPVFSNTASNQSVDSGTAATFTHEIVGATDNVDGNLDGSVVVKYFMADGTTPLANIAAVQNELVNTRSVVITYDVTDSNGNSAATMSVTISSNDTTAPVITVPVATEDIPASQSNIFNFASGITGFDNLDGDISGNIQLTYFEADGTTPLADLAAAQVEIRAGRTIVVKYDLDDSSSNSATQESKTFTVTDDIAPGLTGVGVSQSYDPTDTASFNAAIPTTTDNKDASPAYVIQYFEADGSTPLADISAVRSYMQAAGLSGTTVHIDYIVTDAAGNSYTFSSQATSSVVDNEAPVFDASSDTIFNINASDTATLFLPSVNGNIIPGSTLTVTVTDNYPGNLTVTCGYFEQNGVTSLTEAEAKAQISNGLDIKIVCSADDTVNATVRHIIQVNTADDIAPVFNPMAVRSILINIYFLDSYKLPALEATDNKAGDISNQVIVTYYDPTTLEAYASEAAAKEALKTIGTQVLARYSVSDQAGNTISTELTVKTFEGEKPSNFMMYAAIAGGSVGVLGILFIRGSLKGNKKMKKALVDVQALIKK